MISPELQNLAIPTFSKNCSSHRSPTLQRILFCLRADYYLAINNIWKKRDNLFVVWLYYFVYFKEHNIFRLTTWRRVYVITWFHLRLNRCGQEAEHAHTDHNLHWGISIQEENFIISTLTENESVCIHTSNKPDLINIHGKRHKIFLRPTLLANAQPNLITVASTNILKLLEAS